VTAPHVFTSDLTMDEALLIEDLGFEPVELVMATCYYHVGFTYAGWSTNAEMPIITRAMQHARGIAMTRLVAEAQRVDADGVVGVRIEVEHHGHHAHFLVVGTAVRRKDRAEHSRWRVNRYPFTCDLSGQDFYALVKGGFRPLAMVMGNCVYHVAHLGLGQFLNTLGNNMELPNYTNALYDARELAMGRMQSEALGVGASGVVGMHVHEGSYGWQSHVIEFFAIGTAVAPLTVGAVGADGTVAVPHEPIGTILTANG
jgi:uncharacterized protein YbjQ (UPF0145 family)